MNLGKLEQTNPQAQVATGEEGAPTLATVGAVLAVDIGSLQTRASLFDVVGNEYRFVARSAAPTTAEPPHNDVTAGVFNAVRDLEAITGRTLTEENRLLLPQRRDGSGLDLFIATSSAAPALHVTVAAVSSDISEPSAMQAVGGAYTQVVSRISLDEGIKTIPVEDDALLSKAALAWLQEQVDKLLAMPPDVVLVAGGVEGGPVAPLSRLARVVAEAAREQTSRAERAARANKQAPGVPTVVFAGNSSAAPQVERILKGITEVKTADNLRPELDVEHTGPTEQVISNLYRERRVPQLPGYAVLSRWVEGAVTPTADSIRLIARYLYAHYGRETLIADVGANSTSLFLANAERNAAAIKGEMGLAHGLGGLLAERGLDRIMRWLPFAIDAEELTDWVLNKLVRPHLLPQTARDLAIEHALAREALLAARETLQRGHETEPLRYDLLIGTGGLLAYTPRPSQAAMLMLDSLQPAAEGLGSVELAVDTTLLVPALGNLAPHHLAAASYIFDKDCLVWLGTAIVVQPDGSQAIPQPGDGTAVTVVIERKPGAAETVDVAYGNIRVIPLRPDQRAALTIKPAAGFRVGSGEPGKSLKTEPGQEVKGGLVGLIVDARGRPLSFPDNAEARVEQARRWWTAFDAIPALDPSQPLPQPQAPAPVLPDEQSAGPSTQETSR